MLRWTCELIPHGNEAEKRKIACIEIANDGTGGTDQGNYVVILKKSAPFKNTLISNWRKAILWSKQDTGENTKEIDNIIAGKVTGFHRIKRGPYDLLYRALKACGLHQRN